MRIGSHLYLGLIELFWTIGNLLLTHAHGVAAVFLGSANGKTRHRPLFEALILNYKRDGDRYRLETDTKF